jgi:hypothetical protein
LYSLRGGKSVNKEELLKQTMVICKDCGWEIGRGGIWHDPICDDCALDMDIKQLQEREGVK